MNTYFSRALAWPSVAALVLAAAAAPAGAGVILQDSGEFDRAITFFEPIGQSFVAEDALLGRIAFAFSDINPTSPNEAVTMTLYAGEGTGGVVLGSVAQTLPAVLPGTLAPPQFIDFDFTGQALVVGQTYTAAVTVPSSAKVAVVYSTANPYASGRLIESGAVGATNEDLNFRVTPVPEPASLGLAAVAGLGLLARRRRA